MSKYQEITELYEYCKKNGIDCTIEPLYDGYAIRFPSGGDFVQHSYSYGSCVGYVEPAIGFGCQHDFHAVSLRNAKEIVKRYKDRLNARKGKT